MDINVYEVIRRPRGTTKAQYLSQAFKQIVLEVHPQATKPMIARALKIIFNADAARIGIVNGMSKPKRQGKSRQKFSTGKRYKHAIITLKKGSEAELINATSAMPQTGAYTAEKAE
jgi:ribosomal protein L23